MVVQNKPGASGNLGADWVAKAPAAGLTVLLADIGSLAIAPSGLGGANHLAGTLTEVVATILATQDTQDRLAAAGAEARPGSPAESATSSAAKKCAGPRW